MWGVRPACRSGRSVLQDGMLAGAAVVAVWRRPWLYYGFLDNPPPLLHQGVSHEATRVRPVCRRADRRLGPGRRDAAEDLHRSRRLATRFGAAGLGHGRAGREGDGQAGRRPGHGHGRRPRQVVRQTAGHEGQRHRAKTSPSAARTRSPSRTCSSATCGSAAGSRTWKWGLGGCNAPKDIAAADYPTLRRIKIKHRALPKPASDVEGQWAVCTPSTAPAASRPSASTSPAASRKKPACPSA